MESSEEMSEGKEFDVEDILNDRKVKVYDKGKNHYYFENEYLVKQIGYKKCTWEPEENLENCKETLNKYLQRKRKMIELERNLTYNLVQLNKAKFNYANYVPYSKFGPSFKEVLNVKSTITEEQRRMARQRLLLLNKAKAKKKVMENFIYI